MSRKDRADDDIEGGLDFLENLVTGTNNDRFVEAGLDTRDA